MAAPIISLTVDRQCLCGNNYGLDDSDSQFDGLQDQGPRNSVETTANGLDASFVHLPRSLLVPEPSVKSPTSQENKKGFWNRYKHLRALEAAVTEPENPPRLCLECMQRVEQALVADTERLERECLLYEEAAWAEEQRAESWKQALQVAAMAAATEDSSGPVRFDLEERMRDYHLEIQVLQQACQQQEDEIARLQLIRKEQSLIKKELDRMELAFEGERNSLELEARAFENDQQQLHHTLLDLEEEVEGLSSSQIRLPSLLYNLQVDKERGLRYPLINELRLAYRPKGDVQWNEIQAAWSLAAQLLLAIGTLFHFKSVEWKIVPLSHCAKLIFRPASMEEQSSRKSGTVVYNLGHPRTNASRALSAWLALLHKVVHHVTIKVHESIDCGVLDGEVMPTLPFEISATKIGSVALGQLDTSDDAGWSKAIHYMASDLLWLSECASMFILQKVLLTSI